VSIQSQIVALEELAAVDEEIARLDAELEQERGALGEKHDQLDGLNSKLAATEASIHEMDRVRNELVTEARQMSVQMERSREKLMRCRTEREANAAQREVEELRKLFRDREIEVQKLGNLIDQARDDEQTTQTQREQISGDLGASEGDLRTRLGQLDAEVKEQRERRVGLVKAVPPVLYRRYEMIRKRRGSGLCHTSLGTCSACHISLSPMQFQTLRRGEEFDQCPSCNRIIYYRPEEAVSDQPSGDSTSSAGGGATLDNGA
jgi:hypothetical protein